MKEIRLAIVGSRGFNDYERLCAAVSALAEREQLCVVGDRVRRSQGSGQPWSTLCP